MKEDVYTLNTVKVIGKFDGGNPQSEKCIIRKNKSTFIIYPFSEDNDSNYKFRLDIKALNRSSNPRKVTFHINWKDKEYMEYRDYIFFKNKGDWQLQDGIIRGEVTTFSLTLLPGETYICIHPKYNYTDYLNFVQSLKENTFLDKELVGKTEEKRELWVLKIGNSAIKENKKKIVVFARCHPYETAGSYCVEGMVEFLLLSKEGRKLSERFIFYIFPMINPDGVYNGYCKLTSKGINLSREIIKKKDKVSCFLVDFINQVKPDIFVDIHNWMRKEEDGLYYFDEGEKKLFTAYMPDQLDVGKKWDFIKIPLFPEKGWEKWQFSMTTYCKKKFGSVVFSLEFPWYGRTVKKMRETGKKVLKGLSCF